MYVLVFLDRRKFGVVEEDGMEIIPWVFDSIINLPEENYAVKSNGKFGLVDLTPPRTSV